MTRAIEEAEALLNERTLEEAEMSCNGWVHAALDRRAQMAVLRELIRRLRALEEADRG